MLKKLNLLLAVLIGLVLLIWFQWPKAGLKLVFCNVGQGDATLIIWKSQEVLVDGGPNNRVLDCLGRHLPFWDRTLEVVIASHNEADHITGLVEVVKRYRINQMIVGDQANDTAEFQALERAIRENGVPVKSLTAGSQVKLGRIELSWLWPEPDGPRVLGASTSLNRFSQVIAGNFGSFGWLLPGDIDTAVERQLVSFGTLPEVKVLKVAHHGSKSSSGRSFLEAVKPELAVIEVGKNSFGHPTEEALDRLKQSGSAIKRTDQDGEVVIVSDGRSWQIAD